jgi:hypothetical protein
MSSAFHQGITHVFGSKDSDSNPNVYLVPNKGQTLNLQGNADYATVAGSVSGGIVPNAVNAESLYKGENVDSVNIGVVATISDPLPTGTPYKGCCVSVHNDDMFIGNPGDTRSSKQGTISYYKKVAGTWTYDSFFIPAFVIPSCGAHLQNWGYSISHRSNLMLVSSPVGPVSGASIYKKTAGTWSNVSSTTISGSHVHTDGTNGASWYTIANAEDVDICDNNGAFVRTITTPTKDTQDSWVNSGQVAIACSSGHVYVYTISTGALVTTYSSDNAFGYLVSMDATYLVSVAVDKRSLLIVKRSDGSYYGSFKYTEDVKQIKLENGVLLVGFSDSAMFYYDNGSIFFETQATFSYVTRNDDTSPYASTVWPKVIDFDTGTSTTIVSGEPLSGSGKVNYASITIAPRLTYYSSILLYNNEMMVIAKPKVNIIDTDVNPLNYETCTLQAKGIGSEKIFTGTTKITGTTTSTSTSTGSLINAGGFGNAGRIYTTDMTCVNSILGKNSYCICYNSGTSSPSGVSLNVLFTSPTEVKNNSSMTSNANGVITVGEAGTYLVSNYVSFASNSTGYRETYLTLGSGTYLGSNYAGYNTKNAVSGVPTTMTSSVMLLLTAGTTIQLTGFHNSGSTLNVFGHLSVTKITS